MRKLLLFIILGFFLNHPIHSQSILPKQSYFHFAGTLGDDIQITLDLVKLNDSLYGDYTYHFTSYDQNEYSIFYGNSNQLAGKMSGSNSFRLTEPFSSKGPIVLGKFSNSNTLSGIWETSKGQKFVLRLSEKYPEGSVQFNLFRKEAVKKLVNKSISPKAGIKIVFLLPGESSDILLSDTLRNIMQQCFFGKSPQNATPELLIKGMEDVFFENYISSNESLYKEMPDGASFDWELLKYMHILNNNQNLLTFYIISYAFTGGAHGLETHDYYSIDLKKGKILHPGDILKTESEKELTVLLTEKLKQMIGVAGNQKLTEAGYFVDDVKPNENIYVTDNGIGFFYNHYELAPYSFGFTDIFLPFNELKSILK